MAMTYCVGFLVRMMMMIVDSRVVRHSILIPRISPLEDTPSDHLGVVVVACGSLVPVLIVVT